MGPSVRLDVILVVNEDQRSDRARGASSLAWGGGPGPTPPPIPTNAMTPPEYGTGG